MVFETTLHVRHGYIHLQLCALHTSLSFPGFRCGRLTPEHPYAWRNCFNSACCLGVWSNQKRPRKAGILVKVKKTHLHFRSDVLLWMLGCSFFLDISSQNAALRILCKWFVVAGQLQHRVFKLGQVYTVFSNYFHDWKTASNWIFNLFPIKQHPTIGKKTTIFGYFVWEKVASDDSMTRHILLVHLRDFSCNVRRWSCVEKGNQMISNRHQSIQSIHINIPIHLRIHIYVRTYIYIYTVRISASW